MLRPVAIAAVVSAAIAVPMAFPRNWLVLVAALVLSQIAMVTVFNLATGYLGYLPFGFYALYGVGSMVTGVAIARWGFSPYAALAAAALGGLALSSFFGALALRLRPAYFAFSTFVFAQVVAYVFQALSQWGRIAYLTFDPAVRLSIPEIYWGQLFLAVGTVVFVYFLVRSKWGLAIVAIREDEDAAAARGVRTGILKFMTITAIGVTPAISGGLFSWYYSYTTNETSFNTSIVVQTLLAMFVGGRGTIIGPVIGGILVSSLHTYLTEPYLADFAFAAAVVLILLISPAGLVGFLKRMSRSVRNGKPIHGGE